MPLSILVIGDSLVRRLQFSSIEGLLQSCESTFSLSHHTSVDLIASRGVGADFLSEISVGQDYDIVIVCSGMS